MQGLLATTLQKWTHRHMLTSLLLLSFSEDAMRKAGVAHSKSSKDMESHVFLKAKTRVRPWWVAQEEEDVMQIWKPLCLGSGDGVAFHRLIPETIGFVCSTLDLVSSVDTRRVLGDSQAQPPTPDLTASTLHSWLAPMNFVGQSLRPQLLLQKGQAL